MLEKVADCYLVGKKVGHAIEYGVMFFTKKEADEYLAKFNKYGQLEVIPRWIHKIRK